MADSLNVAFVASEMVPFAKTGGLADVVGALPKALAALGHRCTVFLPRSKPFRHPPAQRPRPAAGDHRDWCSPRVDARSAETLNQPPHRPVVF